MQILKDLYTGIIGSFDNTEKGFSSRKLTGFAIASCVIAAHIKWLAIGDLSNLEMVLTIDYGFITAVFGLTTFSSTKKANPEEKKG